MSYGMMNLRDKPLRTKMLFGVAIVIMIICIGTAVNFFIIKSVLVRSKDRDLGNVFRYYVAQINTTTGDMIANGVSVALTGELLYRLNAQYGTAVPDDVVVSFLVNKVRKMPAIIGSGLWYEPYLFGGKRFFGPYAYWDRNAVRITWEYNTPAYNYPEREWYTIAIPRGWDRARRREQQVYVTRPYSDTLGGSPATFITMSTPMYSMEGRIIGVSTTDWTIETIQGHLAFIKDFSYTPGSFVMLVSGVDGRVIFHTNKRRIMTDIASTPIGRKLDIGKVAGDRTSVMRDVELDGERYDVLARRTDAGFLLLLAVPPAELYADVKRTLVAFAVLSVLLIMLAGIIFVRFLDVGILRRILSLNDRISQIDKGEYAGELAAGERDELARIADNINHMSKTILNREQQLIGLQRYLSNIIESMPLVLISLELPGTVNRWNSAAARHTGISAADAIGEILWELEPQFVRFRPSFETTIQTGMSTFLPRETIIFTEKKYYNVSMFPLAETDTPCGVIMLDDITDIEQKDEELRQMQKMEIIGTLAGGLAHDFNNVLSGILGTASLMKYRMTEKTLPQKDEVTASLAMIEESAQRAAGIVNQLMVLSRKHELVTLPVDLNETIARVAKICANTFDKSVEIRTMPHDGPAITSADPVQMDQVVLNLCVNASHAMTIMRPPGEKAGGVLTLSIDSIRTDRHFTRQQPEALPDTTYWVLSVRDTGVGIEQKLVSKIFEPFFTTKQDRAGTGLGLSMAYSIVKQHGGFINVYSEPGIGSTFNVYLPSSSDTQLPSTAEDRSKYYQGSGLILVVEDEPAIRSTVGAMLRKCGYSVVLAEDGEQGRLLFRERHGEISAVILDMVMPHLSGRDTYLAMREIDPYVRVLLTSGFKKDDRVDEVIARGVGGFIQKPFTMEQLLKALWDVIQNP